jgi:uncharacterized membrane protein
MTEGRWQNWAPIAAGYTAGLAGLFKIVSMVPVLEAILIAVLLPSSAVVIYLSATLILARDASSTADRALAKTYDRILFDVVLFIVALQVLIVATLAGVLQSVSGLARVPIILFGLLGIAVGNLLPRTRPNLAIGIRTRRTLRDRQAWISTHRIAGSLAVFFGIVFVVGGLFLSKPHVETILGTVSLAAAALLLTEHLRSRAA